MNDDVKMFVGNEHSAEVVPVQAGQFHDGDGATALGLEPGFDAVQVRAVTQFELTVGVPCFVADLPVIHDVAVALPIGCSEVRLQAVVRCLIWWCWRTFMSGTDRLASAVTVIHRVIHVKSVRCG